MHRVLRGRRGRRGPARGARRVGAGRICPLLARLYGRRVHLARRARISPVRDRARELGLAFAAALTVHLALVAWLIALGAPPALRVFVIFGFGAFLTLLLTLLSIPGLSAHFSRSTLSWFRSLAMTYIALAFLRDFAQRPFRADLSTT